MTRHLFAKLIVVAAIAVASVVVAGQPAAAGSPRHIPPNLVVLGDSFAAGTGNTPYQVDDGNCDRSADVAYGVLLQRLRLVTLQGFAACKGAWTTDVISTQLGAITADTDIVTVQALGNDFGFSTLAAFCLGRVPNATCHRDQMLPIGPGIRVQALLDSIPARAPGLLAALYGAIDARLGEVGARARVIVVDYGDPLPAPGRRIGPFCDDALDQEELGVAAEFANNLNAAMRAAARRPGYSFADAAPRFRGLDICGVASAFYRPAGPGSPTPEGQAGILHPNRLGQGVYAGVLAGRLYF